MRTELLRQHLDVLLLALVTGCCGVLFIAHEKGWLGQVRVKESYSLEDAFERLQPSVAPAASSNQSPPEPVRSRAAVVEDETFNPRANKRQTPPAHEPGKAVYGVNVPLNGLQILPPDDPWNTPIDQEPVDPMSAAIIRTIGADKGLFPDFGSGYWNGGEIGIPYVVVGKDQPLVPVTYTAYGDESDPGPFPIPPFAPVEGDPNVDGDRHCLIIDRDNHKLYELFRAFSIADGKLWRAESGAVFDLRKSPDRPAGWTSADAAGLPVFPGLVRYEEVVELGEIKHALRFTVQKSRRAYVPPAKHYASRDTNSLLPPMGMRVRLRKDYDISGFPREAQVILTCLKKYGMILADNGSNWFISGSPDPRWNDDAVKTIRKVLGSDLEVVLMRDLVAAE
jgi:hypothetical protein